MKGQSQYKDNITVEINDEINKLIFESYYSDKFFRLVRVETFDIQLKDSFQLEQNKNQLLNLTTSDGGRSGEFFFFTSDNKWILKTITSVELKAFQSFINDYFIYIEENQNSLINRIYGLFKFQFSQMKLLFKTSQVKLIIMKNLSIVPKKYIIAIYDLKGSTYERQVLKEKDKNKDNFKFKTLKDLDFEEIEQKVKISAEDAEKGWVEIKLILFIVKESLTKDVRFFQQHEIIDYSLLIMKVHWKQYLQDSNQEDFKDQMMHLGCTLMICKSIQDEGLYYHFAIIDYFQKWNVNKIAEQNTKKIMKLNYKLDISAQNPSVYAERFIQNVIQKIF